MRNLKIMICTAVMVLILGVPAFAAFTDGSLDNFTSANNLDEYLQSTGTSGGFFSGYTNNVPTGLYDVTFAYGEARRDNFWTAAIGGSLANGASNVGDTLTGVSLQDSFFTTSTLLGSFTSSIGSISSVMIFEVLKDFTVNSINFVSGDYLIGFNDNLLNLFGDYDDMVLKASATSHTPIPGAIWLLGSGLVGLLGLRRKFA